jgi:16S rRNA (adenine1518-N6/adenine1519-N6)-dimethyltransferase
VSVRSSRQRELGQNFLVDRNILDVIERLAELRSDDVVLEIGGGPGILTERLAARAAFVHTVELDERLRERLTAAVAGASNVALHFADALTLDLAALTPAPGKLIANLPYGVAATVILRTIDELPSLQRWVVMVQREVGERFAAAPGSAAYGIPSVLAQLACEVKVLRQVARQVFRPVPNVDSVLLGLTRTGPGAGPALNALVHGAFAHRRKTLAGSLALSPDATRALAGAGAGADGTDGRARVRAALTGLGHPPDVRAERLSPPEFRALAERLTR